MSVTEVTGLLVCVAGALDLNDTGTFDFSGTAGAVVDVEVFESAIAFPVWLGRSREAWVAVSFAIGIGAVSVLAKASADLADAGPPSSTGKADVLIPARLASSSVICDC